MYPNRYSASCPRYSSTAGALTAAAGRGDDEDAESRVCSPRAYSAMPAYHDGRRVPE